MKCHSCCKSIFDTNYMLNRIGQIFCKDCWDSWETYKAQKDKKEKPMRCDVCGEGVVYRLDGEAFCSKACYAKHLGFGKPISLGVDVVFQNNVKQKEKPMLSKEEKTGILRALCSYLRHLSVLSAFRKDEPEAQNSCVEELKEIASLFWVVTDKFIADDGVNGE